MQEGAPQPQAHQNPEGVITGFDGMDPQAHQASEAPQQGVIENVDWAAPVENAQQSATPTSSEVITSFPGLPQPQERAVGDSSVVIGSDRAHTVGHTPAPTGKPFINTSWLDK